MEVSAIPLNDFSEEADVSIRPENRRLIEMTGVRIRDSIDFKDRAEVIMPNKEILIAAGSYDDLIKRLESAQVVIARA